MSDLLTIRNLAVSFNGLPAVDRIDLTVKPGEVVGVVGESGSGKSVTMMALMGLIDAPGIVTADQVTFNGVDLLKASARQRRKIIGKDIAMVFQDALSSLNPSYTVGYQIKEVLQASRRLARREAAATRARIARSSRDSRREEPYRCIPAPDVRRHEPARDDRDGRRVQSEAADRRRTHHRARRHHPGADHGVADAPSNTSMCTSTPFSVLLGASSSSPMICAAQPIVTSSAVVGSSAISSWVAGNRHRDHHALVVRPTCDAETSRCESSRRGNPNA